MTSSKLRSTFLLCAAAVLSPLASANSACAPGTPQLIVYHAGSLTAAFSAVEALLTQQTGICVTDVAAGSVDAASGLHSSFGRNDSDLRMTRVKKASAIFR